MARPQSELQTILSNIEGVVAAYFQKDSGMEYPCIRYQRDRSLPFFADNVLYMFKKGYQVTVMDRSPDSLIPDLVEALPFTRFDRFYTKDGLNHFVFTLYF